MFHVVHIMHADTQCLFDKVHGRALMGSVYEDTKSRKLPKLDPFFEIKRTKSNSKYVLLDRPHCTILMERELSAMR